jgi:F0F1-type ATP synthase membrane subunit c/vacuolar-type H+-ATPase subunit K
MLTNEKIEEEIKSENLNTVKIITVVLNIGVGLFALVCFVLYFNGEGNSDETELLDILIGVLFLVASTTYAIASFLPKKILVNNLKRTDQSLISSITIYQIIKLAMYEAPALFGLVIIILGITNKAIYSNDYLLIAIIPMIVLIAHSIITFPSEFRVKAFLKEINVEMQLNNNNQIG